MLLPSKHRDRLYPVTPPASPQTPPSFLMSNHHRASFMVPPGECFSSVSSLALAHVYFKLKCPLWSEYKNNVMDSRIDTSLGNTSELPQPTDSFPLSHINSQLPPSMVVTKNLCQHLYCSSLP